MKILSLYQGINASASIYIDGKVIDSTHEERFARIKNAITYCLKEANITADDLDGVAIASYIQGFYFTVLRKAHWNIKDCIRATCKFKQ